MPWDPICKMDVKESSPWHLIQAQKTYYFCSQHCLKKFAVENAIDLSLIDSCCALLSKQWYKNKTLIVALILIASILLSYLFPILIPFREALLMYLKMIWWAILLGLFLGGLMDYYIPREYISQILAKPQKRTIFYAVGLGTLASVCSHGILAIAMELYKKGASTPSVVAFLLASPWTGLPITLLLIGFFGIIKAFHIILGAIVIALVTGLIYQVLEEKNFIESNDNTLTIKSDFSILNDIKQRFQDYKFTKEQLFSDFKGIVEGVFALGDMVVWWILIGIALASLTGAYVPKNIFQHYMGPTLLGMTVTLIVATIIEVCSEGTAPLAFELYKQTGALGNSFVFLMAGVVTDYTEIGLLWHNVGKKTALWLPVITVPQVILWGLLANRIF